jgi:hypothetical protein
MNLRLVWSAILASPVVKHAGGGKVSASLLQARCGAEA